MDWKHKLTSRKFWAAVAQFVSMMIVAFHGSQETATQVVALIMAGAGLVAYIIGEGLIDSAAADLKKPNRSPAERVRFGEEEGRSGYGAFAMPGGSEVERVSSDDAEGLTDAAAAATNRDDIEY